MPHPSRNDLDGVARGTGGAGRPPHELLTDKQWKSIAAQLPLTCRQLEIVQHLFDGRKETAIAHALDLSPHTVHSHLKRLYRKLEVADHAELIVRIFAAYIALNPHLETLPSKSSPKNHSPSRTQRSTRRDNL